MLKQPSLNEEIFSDLSIIVGLIKTCFLKSLLIKVSLGSINGSASIMNSRMDNPI